MCLGTPMKILSIQDDKAVCEGNGIRQEVALHLLNSEKLCTGDYVVTHLGFAIEVILKEDAREAESTWAAWQKHVRLNSGNS